jgi:assimilatory nitrate reductase catalytic subunit
VTQLWHLLGQLFQQRDGALTRDLAREPGIGDLGQVPRRIAPDAVTGMVCGYCATGCSLDIHLKQGRAVNVSPSAEYPVNLGSACPKGWEALSVLASPERATVPLLREPNGPARPIDWDQALRTFCARIRSIQQQHGPDSVAFLGTGQIVNEELALLGCLAKFGMGMVHGDANTRQCMATAVSAYKESFGFDAPPYTYQDLEEADVIVLVGSNLCIAHPILWERICRNRRRPEIVVVDPRYTETAAAATWHLPIAPKSDMWLCYAAAHILFRNGWIDTDFVHAHTSGLNDFAAFLSSYTPDAAAAQTGLTTTQIEQFAERLRPGRRVSYWWTMGVNQSHQGTRTAQSLINLALMTGNIGKPGCGANSITGQCNAMGSRLFSNTASLLGGRNFDCSADRSDVARILDIDPDCIPPRSSWPYHRILEGIRRGEIRGLWIVCTNPGHSWINQSDAQQLLRQLDFLVVQDMYSNTDTARLAHLLLPAAGWGEKDGTLINSERRIGLVKRVAQAPGEALADFWIFKLIAEYWGCGPMFRRWTDPESVFQLLKALSRGRPCDFSGIDDYLALEQSGGVQWPCPEPARGVARQRRLFADGQFFHVDGRARFVWEPPRTLVEPADDEYPYVLLTGRGSVAQWHTQTRSAQSPVLRKLYPEQLYVEIHPDDAQRHEIRRGQWVQVVSRRGRIAARAFITGSVQRGQLFLPMHYQATNQLTHPHFDAHSHQPCYKDCAVKLETKSEEGEPCDE